MAGFRTRINGRATALETNVNRIKRKAALAIDQAVVSATPVDKGRARSNWIVSLGSPSTDTKDAYSPGEKGSTGAQNVTAALAQGSAVVGSAKLGDVIFIVNNLEYIGKLNDGSSAQAPAGFVGAMVQAGTDAVHGARLLGP